MIAISMVGVLSLAAMDLMSFLHLQMNRARLLNDSAISTSLGERFLYVHLRHAGPSYNNLQLPFATDTSGLNFFDLNADYPIKKRPLAQRSRHVILTPGGTTVFYVLVEDPIDGPPVYIDPVRFFNSTGPTQPMTSGTLSFAGGEPYLTFIAPHLWQTGKLLYFRTANNVRKPSLAPAAFAPSYSFLTRVVGGSLVPETLGGALNFVDPMDGAPIPDFPTYLRWLPSTSGGIPVVLMTSVKFLKYEIVPRPFPAGRFDLVFSSWDGAGFLPPQTAATDIEKVTIERDSVADSTINFSVVTKDRR